MSELRMEQLACQLAAKWHKDQVRKYTGERYFVHLAEVAALTDLIADVPGVPRGVIRSAGWLHDCKEDQGISDRQIRHEFKAFPKEEVDLLVYGINQLSDLDKGNRSQRIVLSAARLIKADGWVQSVKCCDSSSNTGSIALHDPSFAKVYIPEKKLLLTCLGKADPVVSKLAWDNISIAEGLLVQHDLAAREGTTLVEHLTGVKK